jgi:hypothetical protein
MSQRCAKILLVLGMLVALSQVNIHRCAAWSLNPFASGDNSESRTYISAKRSQSPLDKLATGTKNFFNKTGEALHLKKPAPKKPPAIVAAKPPAIPQRQQKSWLTGMFSKKEDRPARVVDWLSSTKQVTP